MKRTITITLTYDDVRWHDRDAERAAIDAAFGLREIARYHPGSEVKATTGRTPLPMEREESSR